MQNIAKILVPGTDFALVSVADVKTALRLTADDAQLELLIDWASDDIATLCNRVFAKETVEEQFFDMANMSDLLFLSHAPMARVGTPPNDDYDEVVFEGSTQLVRNVDYDFEPASSKFFRKNGTAWAEPVTITYTGGYDLPEESPMALRQAVMLLTREMYYASIRGDSTIRSVSHKDARVMYFDPNLLAAKSLGAAGGGGSPAHRAIHDLLTHFTRYAI